MNGQRVDEKPHKDDEEPPDAAGGKSWGWLDWSYESPTSKSRLRVAFRFVVIAAGIGVVWLFRAVVELLHIVADMLNGVPRK